MAQLPAFDLRKNMIHSPHVVILGAGASRAACPNGDANGRLVPLQADLVDCLDLRTTLGEAGISDVTDFEKAYDDLASSGRNPSLVEDVQNRVLEYFEGLDLPEQVTLYDYLVLSLREKDLIATFNWDPFLIQAYIRNRPFARLPRLVFLHGNVLAAACVKDRVKDFFGQKCSRCGEPMSRPRLLYPVRHKNYKSDPFIANEWLELEASLEDSYMLTIFGYAAPSTDVEAVGLMRQGWAANPTFELARTMAR